MEGESAALGTLVALKTAQMLWRGSSCAREWRAGPGGSWLRSWLGEGSGGPVLSGGC